MFIEDEIRRVVIERNRSSQADLERDYNMIIEYFGYGEEKAPTLKSISNKFENISRERVRQIIEKKFVSKLETTDFSVLKEVNTLLYSKEIWFASDFILTLIENDLINDILDIYGFLNLLEKFNYAKDYKIYNF